MGSCYSAFTVIGVKGAPTMKTITEEYRGCEDHGEMMSPFCPQCGSKCGHVQKTEYSKEWIHFCHEYELDLVGDSFNESYGNQRKPLIRLFNPRSGEQVTGIPVTMVLNWTDQVDFFDLSDLESIKATAITQLRMLGMSTETLGIYTIML